MTPATGAGGERGFEEELRELLKPHAQRIAELGYGARVASWLNPAATLPSWEQVAALMRSVRVRPERAHRLPSLHREAQRRRRPAVQPAGPAAANGNATTNASATRNGNAGANGHGRVPRPVPEDAEGFDEKPDPLRRGSEPQTFHDLDRLLLDYWTWSGRPSSRTVAGRSGSSFSHATANKLTGGGTGREAGAWAFSIKLDYVRGFIQGCGGGDDDQRAWATAWRRVVRRSTGSRPSRDGL